MPEKNGYMKIRTFLTIAIPVVLFLIGAFVASVNAIDKDLKITSEKAVVNEANILNIADDIGEIKSDIKLLLQK